MPPTKVGDVVRVTWTNHPWWWLVGLVTEIHVDKTAIIVRATDTQATRGGWKVGVLYGFIWGHHKWEPAHPTIVWSYAEEETSHDN